MEKFEINRTLFMPESQGLNAYLEKGVLLFYKPKSPISTWNHIILGHKHQDRLIFEDAFSAVSCDKWKGHYFSPNSDILAIDSDGDILLRNCEVSVKKDDSGFIHVYEPKTNFYSIVRAFPLKESPHKFVYVITEDVSKLNGRISSLVSKKIINKPSFFSLQKGLRTLPVFQTPEQFEK